MLFGLDIVLDIRCEDGSSGIELPDDQHIKKVENEDCKYTLHPEREDYISIREENKEDPN